MRKEQRQCNREMDRMDRGQKHKREKMSGRGHKSVMKEAANNVFDDWMFWDFFGDLDFDFDGRGDAVLRSDR